MIVHRLARPMLAAIFVAMGVDHLRNPKPVIEMSRTKIESTVARLGDSVPEGVPTDPETLVRIDAIVKTVAGAGLALGRFPRLSALLLVADIVPTTFVGHAFWTIEDPGQRAMQRTHFLKNLGLIGGLLSTAAAPRRQRSTDE
jgi:putative oxidoreductase